MADPYYALNLLRRGGEDQRGWQRAVRGQAIALIRPQLLMSRDKACIADGSAEVLQDSLFDNLAP
jgi:hypothetical protein